jgi:hypothetical protein
MYATNRFRDLSELPRDLAAPENLYVALWEAWAERHAKARLPWNEPPQSVPSPAAVPRLVTALQQARPTFRISNATQLERVTAAIARADWRTVRHLVLLDVWERTQAEHGVELDWRPLPPLPIAEDRSLGDLWAREVTNGGARPATPPARSSGRRRSPTA